MQNPTPIPYAHPHTKEGKADRALPWAILCLLLTALATFTCLRIELLNAQLGFYLPRDFTADPGKWRGSWIDTETSWRQSQADRTADPSLLTRPLTPTEHADMQRTITRERTNDALRETVSTLGLLQYPLTFTLAIALPCLFFRLRTTPWKLAMATCTALTLLSLTLMLYRGYFPSLGM